MKFYSGVLNPMSGSNRRIFIALGLVGIITLFIGLWTLPASFPTQQFRYDSPRNEDYRPGGAKCEPAVLSAITDAKVRLNKAENCQKQAEEYRQTSNDLIQQTRAANAAQAQADIASQQLWTGWLQTIGGLLTLAAAVGAAIYARDAASHTRHANEIARDAQRAWVKFEPKVYKAEKAGNILKVSIRVDAINIGQSVARDIAFKASLFPSVEKFDEGLDRVRLSIEDNGAFKTHLVPGDMLSHWCEGGYSLDALIPDDQTGRAIFMIFVAARYSVIGESGRKIAELAFSLCETENLDPFEPHGLKIPISAWLSPDDIKVMPAGKSRIT